jgi:F-type H+-transporting ATPase subunit epsilon
VWQFIQIKKIEAMMNKTLHLSVVDTHNEIFNGEITEVTVSGIMGGLTVLAGHAPLISLLKAGEMHYSTVLGEPESLFVYGGIMEVQPKIVTVLADNILRTSELDADAAKESMERAREDIKTVGIGSDAYKELAREMQIMKALITLSRKTSRLGMKRY